MCNYAQDQCSKKVFSNPKMRAIWGIEEMVDFSDTKTTDNLKSSITTAPPDSENPNDSGISNLGLVIAGINPEKVWVGNDEDYKNVRENRNLHLDSSFGLAVATHMTNPEL